MQGVMDVGHARRYVPFIASVGAILIVLIRSNVYAVDVVFQDVGVNI